MSFRRWDPIDEAVQILDLPSNHRPSKQAIERAFRVAAKKHHPDTANNIINNINNNNGADQGALRFRQCLEARDLLLNRFHNGRVPRRCARPGPPPPRPPRASDTHTHRTHTTSGNGVFAKGFPFHTLHLLTTNAKVCIKGATGVLVLALGLYDGYTRLNNNNNHQSHKKKTNTNHHHSSMVRNET